MTDRLAPVTACRLINRPSASEQLPQMSPTACCPNFRKVPLAGRGASCVSPSMVVSHRLRDLSPDDRRHVDAFRLHEIVHGSVSLATSAPAPTTAVALLNFARPWLKYLGRWREPPAEPIAFAPALDRFVSWMRDERGLTPCTIDQWRDRTATLLRWCSVTGRDLATLKPQDIDAYFVTYGAQRWSRISAGHIAKMLRVLLRHAAREG